MAQEQICLISDMGHLIPQIKSTTTSKSKIFQDKISNTWDCFVQRRNLNQAKFQNTSDGHKCGRNGQITLIWNKLDQKGAWWYTREAQHIDSVKLFDDFRSLKSSLFDDFRALKFTIKFDDFSALKSSFFDCFRALKSSLFWNFRALKFSFFDDFRVLNYSKLDDINRKKHTHIESKYHIYSILKEK